MSLSSLLLLFLLSNIAITNAIFSPDLDKKNIFPYGEFEVVEVETPNIVSRKLLHVFPKRNLNHNSINGHLVKGYQSTRFHELPKGYVPPSHGSQGSNGKSPQHPSTNSNKGLIVKGNQSTRFYELSKGYVPPSQGSHRSNDKSPLLLQPTPTMDMLSKVIKV
ncbi:hypothetical protein ACSQ67_010420 [Phaseolus vulgaris]